MVAELRQLRVLRAEIQPCEKEYQLDTRLNEATQEKRTDDIVPGEVKKQLFYAVEHLSTEPKVTDQCPCLSKS